MHQHDPYAGQYPTPLPLASLDSNSSHYNYNYSYSSSNYQPIHPNNNNYINNNNNNQNNNNNNNNQYYLNSTPSPIPHHHDNAEFAYYNNSTNNLYNATYNAQAQQIQQQQQEEEDPNSLAAYLRQEREEYLAHKYHRVTSVEPIPQYQITYSAKPTPPPINEADSYKPRPVNFEKHSRGCCSICCCYNPAMTCCSCFCMLISLAFVVAGIALMVASKIMEEKCGYQCDRVIPQEQCGTICSTVLHDGMFYGGIVVAGLAALSVIWRIIRWTCAGCSQH